MLSLLPLGTAGMVRWLQPNHFRLLSLLPPPKVACLSLKQAVAADGDSSGSSGSSSVEGPAAPKGAPLAPANLPYVPEFFSLAAAVKQDPHLLLRHADLDDADVAPASSAADEGTWGALRSSALSSPSCLLRSLAFLWCGSSIPAAAVAAPPTAPSSLPPPAVRPELLPAAMPGHLPLTSSDGEPALLRAHPGSWKLSSGVLPGSAGAVRSSNRRGLSADGEPAEPADVAQEGASRLDHAESIAARLPLSYATRRGSRTSSSRTSSGGGTRADAHSTDSEGFETLVRDAGHLLGNSCSNSRAAAEAAAAAAEAAADGKQGSYWWQFF